MMHQPFSNMNVFQQYELCRRQSPCLLLSPPPRLPVFPKLFFTEPSSVSTLISLRHRVDSLPLMFGILLVLLFTCCLLLLLTIRQRQRQTKVVSHESTSLSSIAPTLCSSLTMTNNSINIYEEIRSSSRARMFPSYQQEYNSPSPYYYMCELSPSNFLCHNRLFTDQKEGN